MTKEISTAALKRTMRKSGLKLQWVARRAGVSYFIASDVLNGHRVSPGVLRKLSRVIQHADQVLSTIP